MTLHPASTLRVTHDVPGGVCPRVVLAGGRSARGSSGRVLRVRSFRLVRLSAASAICKQSDSPRASGNHLSIRASSSHRFVGYFGGAWLIRRDSIVWDQGVNGCSPPTSSRHRPECGSFERAVRPISAPVTRSLLAAGLGVSRGRTPFCPSTCVGRRPRSGGPV